MGIDLTVLTGCHIIIQRIANGHTAVQGHSQLHTVLKDAGDHFHIRLCACLILYNRSKGDQLLHAHIALFDIRLIRLDRCFKLIQKGFRDFLRCRILMKAVGFRIQVSLQLHPILSIQNILVQK